MHIYLVCECHKVKVLPDVLLDHLADAAALDLKKEKLIQCFLIKM